MANDLPPLRLLIAAILMSSRPLDPSVVPAALRQADALLAQERETRPDKEAV